MFFEKSKNSDYCSFHISLSKAFWRLYLYYLFFRSETYMICVNVFYVVRNEISTGSDKDKEIPHRPPSCLDVTKVSGFYNGGLWGNFSNFVGSN